MTMNRDELIERVAKAINRAFGGRDDLWHIKQSQAVAALQSIDQAGLVIVPREATDEIEETIEAVLRQCPLGDVIWDAALRVAALQEKVR